MIKVIDFSVQITSIRSSVVEQIKSIYLAFGHKTKSNEMHICNAINGIFSISMHCYTPWPKWYMSAYYIWMSFQIFHAMAVSVQPYANYFMTSLSTTIECYSLFYRFLQSWISFYFCFVLFLGVCFFCIYSCWTNDGTLRCNIC